MTVAAIIPTYNRREQALRAVESVLAQTLSADEIIVIDDGSSDGTSEALRARFGERIRVIEQPNQGVSAARSRGVDEARSEWVAFLDSDDIWLPAKLEKQFAAVSSMGPEFGACFTNCGYFGNPEKVATVFEEVGLPLGTEFGEAGSPIQYIIGDLGIMMQSVLVRRKLVQKVGGFDRSLGISEDRDLVLKLSFETRFCYVSEPLVSIDRTPDLPRLTGRLNRKTDESYRCMEVLLLRLMEKSRPVDRGLHQRIRSQLLDLYYAWARERIGGFKFGVAFEKIAAIRRLGHSRPAILGNLASSAGRKFARMLVAKSNA